MSPNVTLDDLSTTVSPAEAAARLGVTVGTLANWRWAGRPPAYCKIGGRVRYRLSSIAEFLDAQTRTSTSDLGRRAER